MNVFEAKRLAEETVSKQQNNSSSVIYWVLVQMGQALICNNFCTAMDNAAGCYVFSVRFVNGEAVATLQG